ncbi:hypothetical protein JG688_00008279, partial [Phytophthora aleatoria]
PVVIDRFFKIENQLRQVREIELPRDSDIQVLQNMFPTLENFNSIMVRLQGKDVTVVSTRGSFDELLEDYPERNHYLAQYASVTHKLMFEAAVAKVQTTR